MAERVLVVGGAGYIGTHMVKCLLDHGIQVTVLDNLSTGRRELVQAEDFVRGDMADSDLLVSLFKTRKITAVMLFAACIDVGESVRDPGKYFENNVAKTIGLLNAMVHFGVRQMIFSSSCAVYGIPEISPIDENTPFSPINPYGESKLWVERMLVAYEKAHNLRSYRLRYFNAAGADPGGTLGECHDPETHLIPLALKVAAGKLPLLHIFGDDYKTPDGTCVRDYIHVNDLSEAHRLALLDLFAGGKGGALNVGIGRGFSVKQIIAAVEDVTGARVNTRLSSRRPGDPAELVANASRLRNQLGWTPRFLSIKEIIGHAWAWERKRSG